ncbi:uncharacterized protein LOC126897335 [Daktulosphaira vitifoliae]|uniref:uncharacterized protein LOC126897335 n=1 Tax=Daktulosphaira vitifoliae TaxID=58002 RepID=UPI0021A9A434|nr:uncharacterized protein LOC126897335 [Daktulosphaira vitifoliae]XP_050526824.1 uncharacterized protein LOC126897335 [Daktulosphaira vitifoliae]XP_050526825.1 uncharacterized protein LOC126897335 [Daktulosphaira vitifoliae]
MNYLITMSVHKIFYIFVLWFNISTAIEYTELNCNFSRYVLNYFKHNEKYLLKLEEDKSNILIGDLQIYGRAIQSHGEIVIAMLEALRSDWLNYPSSLMEVNLYLNNVSGSVEMSFKNKSGKFDDSNRILNLLEGFLMIHKAIVKRLEYFILSTCSGISFEEVFTNCPDFNKEKDYRIKFLPDIVEKLKNRFSITDLQLKDYRLKLKHSEVFRILKLAMTNDSRWDFHPKKLLYYDLMMGQQKFGERNLLSSAQYRKIPEVKDCHVVNVIDYFKFSPLTYKCPDDSYVTLFDVFRYMKYNFNTKQLQGYQELVLASTIRPILLVVRMYISFLKTFDDFCKSSWYDKSKNNLDQIRISLTEIGTAIIKQIEYFNKQFIIQKLPKTYLNNICNDIRNIVGKDISQSYRTLNCIKLSTKNFFSNNKLNSYCGIRMDYKTTHFNNIVQLYNMFSQRVSEMSTYLIELDKYKESLHVVNKTRNISSFYFSRSSYEIFKPYLTMINRLCSPNIYNEIYNLESTESINDETSRIHTVNQDTVDNEKQTDIQNNEDLSELNIPQPKYMIDYILFIQYS